MQFSKYMSDWSLSVIKNQNLFWSLITGKNQFLWSGGHLLSHTVSSAVPSADQVLTIVFEMGTGVSPDRIATRNIEFLAKSFWA